VRLAWEGTVFCAETFSQFSPLIYEQVIPSEIYEFKKLRFGKESRE
jgi:hypothetical protein